MSDLAQAAGDLGLSVLGGFHPEEDAHLPPGTATLILLGPALSGFWEHVTGEPEFADGLADPLDRWSLRVVGALASEFGGTALFPFGGPPWLPFLDWSQRALGLWPSPVGMLVHHTAGLMVSIRGAVALPDRLELAPAGPAPCATCAAPCRTACPVDALHGDRYDIQACRDHIASPDGVDCLTQGCRARRICPLSPGAGRSDAQSAYHMRLFAGAS